MARVLILPTLLSMICLLPAAAYAGNVEIYTADLPEVEMVETPGNRRRRPCCGARLGLRGDRLVGARRDTQS